MKVLFKNGIPGFEGLRNFNIDDIKGNESFKVISSEEEKVSFVAISPFDFYSEYELNLSEDTIKDLDIEGSRDVLVLNIVTLGKSLESSTVNLKAPIIINVKNHLAKQSIMQNDMYDTRHPLIRREQNVSNY